MLTCDLMGGVPQPVGMGTSSMTGFHHIPIYSEHIYTQHFLKAGRAWAPFFCDTWAKIQIVISQTPGWKPNKEKQDHIRQRIESSSNLYWYVQRVATSDIKNGIPQPDKPLRRPSRGRYVGRGGGRGGRGRGNGNGAAELPVAENTPVAFGNVTMTMTANGASDRDNLLRLSVTYDSGCSNHLTWDKTRFIGDITPAYEWVSIPDGDLPIEGFGTMLVSGTLKGKNQPVHFRSTAYVQDSA